jgi:hypothetical protein
MWRCNLVCSTQIHTAIFGHYVIGALAFDSAMPEQIYLPTILLSIPRNPVTAVGLPVALGFVRGAFSRDNVKGSWFQVSRRRPFTSGILTRPTEALCSIWTFAY